MQTAPTSSRNAEKPSWAWLLGAAFAGVAVWLGTRPTGLDIPMTEQASFDRTALAPRPLRTAMADPPATVLDGKPQRCGDCHIQEAAAPRPPRPSPHDVTLHHGMNDWCFNCHDAANRERLVLQDTTTVPYSDVPVLCAQCHGTTYRDWQKGTHGKSMGAWDENSERQRRLRCTECHNPHSPAYGRLTPLPGPSTLRMGGPDEHEAGADPSPLTHWRGADGNHKGEAP